MPAGSAGQWEVLRLTALWSSSSGHDDGVEACSRSVAATHALALWAPVGLGAVLLAADSARSADWCSWSSRSEWSAAETWSTNVLSKTIERGASGSPSDATSMSTGVATSGFLFRVKPLVHLRDRYARHSRPWHHSVIDAGPTLNNVRGWGQADRREACAAFRTRRHSLLDDMASRGDAADPPLPRLEAEHVTHCSRRLKQSCAYCVPY